jgi:hypothetical protein
LEQDRLREETIGSSDHREQDNSGAGPTGRRAYWEQEVLGTVPLGADLTGNRVTLEQVPLCTGPARSRKYWEQGHWGQVWSVGRRATGSWSLGSMGPL